jgi:hypothetical protein
MEVEGTGWRVKGDYVVKDGMPCCNRIVVEISDGGRVDAAECTLIERHGNILAFPRLQTDRVGSPKFKPRSKNRCRLMREFSTILQG